MATTVRARRASGAEPAQAPPSRHAKVGLRARVPELVIGVGAMVGFALVGVLWHLSSTERQAVLALASPVERGEVIEASDLRVVYVASDDPIAHLARARAASVVGRPARADMAAGTLLTATSVEDGPRLGADEGVVGLSLEPGQVPVADLVPGDVVDVVGVAGAPADPTAETADANRLGGDPATIATAATVYAVGEVGAQGRQVVSVKLASDDATKVAAAAERGAIRLVLVGTP